MKREKIVIFIIKLIDKKNKTDKLIIHEKKLAQINSV